MYMFTSRTFGMALGLTALLPALSLAGQLPERFTLGSYVPDDVWFIIHGVDNPQRAWIDDQWSEVFKALKNSGVDRDVITLILSLAGEDKRTGIEASIDKATQLLRGVRWGDLIGREFILSERISSSKTGPAYIALARGTEKSGDANFAGLVVILKELSAAICCSELVESQRHGVTVWSLNFEDEDLERLDFSVELFQKGDLIGLTSGLSARNDVLSLLAGTSESGAVVDTPRFREAIALVPPPRDTVMYSDVKTLLRDMGSMLAAIGAGDEQPIAEDLPDAVAQQADQEPCVSEADSANPNDIVLAVMKKLIELGDFVDYGITTNETQGRRELTHAVTRLQPGKHDNPIAEMFFKRRQFERFDRFIPAEATSFTLTGFFDIEGAYKLVTDTIAKDIAGGPELVTKAEAVIASIGLDLQADFFDWWSGEMIMVSLPTTTVTPMGGGDGVWIIRVKNRELASEKVNAAIDFVAEKAQGQGQMLMVSPAQVNVEGFRQITLPLMMMVRPVVGVHGDWLMLGTSSAAINKCLDVEAGKAPSVLENEQFKKEGLIPEGPVLSASFKDTSKSGQQMAAQIGLIGMGGSMFVAGLPEDTPDQKKLKSVLQSVLKIAMKLGPVINKINFYSSESSITTYDGAATVRMESVVTYKPPPPKPPPVVEPPPAPKAPDPDPVR